MDLYDILGALQSILTGEPDTSGIDWSEMSVVTLEDAGIYSRWPGLLIELPDGTEYQITVSRR